METDHEYQTHWLQRIFSEGLNAPVFKKNPKYPIPHSYVPRINYNDVIEYRCVVRQCPVEEIGEKTFWIGEGEIIKEYQSIDDLVHDGWRLD